MDLKMLTVVGILDGVMVAAPLVWAGYRWPEHQGIVWALAIVAGVGGFLATVMGTIIASADTRAMEEMEKYQVNQELE